MDEKNKKGLQTLINLPVDQLISLALLLLQLLLKYGSNIIKVFEVLLQKEITEYDLQVLRDLVKPPDQY